MLIDFKMTRLSRIDGNAGYLSACTYCLHLEFVLKSPKSAKLLRH